MSTDASVTISPARLSVELEKFDRQLIDAAARTRPPLPPVERARVVAIAELAINAQPRETGAAGDVDRAGAEGRVGFAAANVARSLALHDGPTAENPFSDRRLQQAYSEARAIEKAASEKPRWIVQQWSEERGVYRDVLPTNSALVADAAFKSAKDLRVIDASRNDIAADYPRTSHSAPRGAAEYSPYSTFAQVLRAEVLQRSYQHEKVQAPPAQASVHRLEVRSDRAGPER